MKLLVNAVTYLIMIPLLFLLSGFDNKVKIQRLIDSLKTEYPLSGTGKFIAIYMVGLPITLFLEAFSLGISGYGIEILTLCGFMAFIVFSYNSSSEYKYETTRS